MKLTQMPRYQLIDIKKQLIIMKKNISQNNI